MAVKVFDKDITDITVDHLMYDKNFLRIRRLDAYPDDTVVNSVTGRWTYMIRYFSVSLDPAIATPQDYRMTVSIDIGAGRPEEKQCIILGRILDNFYVAPSKVTWLYHSGTQDVDTEKTLHIKNADSLKYSIGHMPPWMVLKQSSTERCTFYLDGAKLSRNGKGHRELTDMIVFLYEKELTERTLEVPVHVMLVE